VPAGDPQVLAAGCRLAIHYVIFISYGRSNNSLSNTLRAVPQFYIILSINNARSAFAGLLASRR